MGSIIACALRGFAAACLLVVAGCAVTPDMQPQYSRKLAEPPAQPFSSVVLVFMPVKRPDERAMAQVYEATWRDPAVWREPFFRRLERNFEHNGIAMKVFDAGRSGSITIAPSQLDLRLSVQHYSLQSNWLSYGIRAEASNRATRYLAMEEVMALQRSPESAADRMTYLILNALREAKLIPPPVKGDTYTLAPNT
jgi:hypothetical protein